jgi:hypothetical protein
MLGDTDVNKEIEETLKKEPQNFWYFNNGITMICEDIDDSIINKEERDFGYFPCKNISIVNGAQTVGVIGKYGEKSKEKLQKVYLPIRIISLKNSYENFGEVITKTNNRQNRIENRDFVTLDKEQGRIQYECAVSDIKYNLIRAEITENNETTFDLTESTTALACASGNIQLAVQLKREIGKLWEDIKKSPYTELFNPNVSGIYVWRCVQTQRKIDKSLIELISTLDDNRNYSIAVHGNRIISLLVFKELDLSKFNDQEYKYNECITESLINGLVKNAFEPLLVKINKDYEGNVIPTLFKNLTKCTEIVQNIK